jgi:hypothetical protein
MVGLVEGLQSVNTTPAAEHHTKQITVPSLFSGLIIIGFVGILGASMSYGPGAAHTVNVSNSFQLVLYAGFLALLSTPFTVIINRYDSLSRFE